MPTNHHHRPYGTIVGKPDGGGNLLKGDTTTVAGHRGIVTHENPHPRDSSGMPLNMPRYDNEFEPSHDDVVIRPTSEGRV